MDLWKVEYVLRRFDAGVLPGQILVEMRSNGCASLHLETIEQCLRVNGRAVDGLDPSVRIPVISNTFDARGYKGQPNSYFGYSSNMASSSGVVAPAAKAPHVPLSEFRPQQSSSSQQGKKKWDQAAARYAIYKCSSPTRPYRNANLGRLKCRWIRLQCRWGCRQFECPRGG